jgi:hypothetical protein
MGRCSACLLLRPTRVSINGCTKPEAAGDELLRLDWRRLATHAAISALLGIPVPPHVAVVRATLQVPQIPARRAASETQEL